MRIIKSIIVIILINVVSVSCVEPFYLNKEDEFSPKMVIEGTFTNEDGPQEIVISKSSSPESPALYPVSGCTVAIEDDRGHTFLLPESTDPGHYRGVVNGSYIIIGAKYRLVVKTSTGVQYESSFEEMMPCPPVNSVYYEREAKPTSNPAVNTDGLQFYGDFQGDDTYGRYYRWKLEETFEYHSTWPVTQYLDEYDTLRIVSDDYSNFICYKTENIGDIFTLSTKDFSRNTYTKYPFHYVNNQTQRLINHYSLLVKQYSLSEQAYGFWENLRKNNQESEDLFGKQPANVKSNIYNKNDPSEVVLGYFGVSAVSSKRIHVSRVPGMLFNQVEFCVARKSSSDPDSMPKSRPLYFAPLADDEGGNITWVWAETTCFICTTLGGTTEKPSYWNEE